MRVVKCAVHGSTPSLSGQRFDYVPNLGYPRGSWVFRRLREVAEPDLCHR